MKTIKVHPIEFWFGLLVWAGGFFFCLWIFVDIAKNIGKAEAIEHYSNLNYECKAELVIKHQKK